MKFIVRVLIFFVVNIALACLTIVINPFPHPVYQLLALISTFAVTGLIAFLMYRLKERRIWYIPLSQVIMCFGCCVFFYVRDMLGYRQGGGFLDFGVVFEIMVTIYISAFWIIPSFIAAIIYARIMKKANDMDAIDFAKTNEYKELLQRIVLICCMAASIVLMALPFGVRMSFAAPGGFPHVFHRSYFSGLPIGYANWFPILTAVLSIAVIIMLFVGVIRNKPDGKLFGKPVFICLCICMIASLMSWILFGTISVVGVIVFMLHTVMVILGMGYKRFHRNDNIDH